MEKSLKERIACLAEKVGRKGSLADRMSAKILIKALEEENLDKIGVQLLKIGGNRASELLKELGKLRSAKITGDTR